jgi:hypothetical protein
MVSQESEADIIKGSLALELRSSLVFSDIIVIIGLEVIAMKVAHEYGRRPNDRRGVVGVPLATLRCYVRAPRPLILVSLTSPPCRPSPTTIITI